MDWQTYTAAARRTMPRDLSEREKLTMLALGLAGESGEVVDLLKKALYHGHALDPRDMAEELGDLCWYLANLVDVLALDWDKLLARNVAKLARRYPDGFDAERSIQRDRACVRMARASRFDTREVW